MKIYKYFLLHNKKLKPWIKYWLYIKSKDKNYVLSDILQGTSFYLENSSNKKFNLFQISGNSIQNSTTGKNLLENTYITSGTQNGITHAKNADGTMLLNGTATATVFMILNTFNLVAGTYILSGCPNGGSENGYRQDILVGNNVITKDFGSGGSFTLNENTSIQARIRIGSGTAINNLTFKPMIRLSSITDASYEPYTGGIASPNPQYEQPINSAGDNINLFDKTANITRGYTYTSTGGTTQLVNSFVQEKYIEVESSKDYILSTTNSYTSETDYRLVICEYDSSKNFIKRNLGATQYYKITTSATTKYVRLCASTVTIDELKFEHGSIATPYTPYGMGSINEVISNSDNTQSQNYTIPCQQPMRSIGNVRDEFIKQDGVWYEKHNIGQVVLNGSESWGFGTSGEQNINVANVYISSILKSNFGQGICNYFIRGTSKTANTLRFGANDKQLWFYVKSMDFANVNDWKTWLSTHNTEVIYQLAEPIYLECTQEQVQVLESITQSHTYKHITNINSTDITPAFLKIQYYMEV